MTARLRAADVMDRATDGHLTLDAEAETIRQEVRSRFGGFVLDRVNPGSRSLDRACRPVDHGLFREAADLGLLQFALPEEVAGGARDKFAWGVAIAEVARLARDPGFPVLLDITVENTELVLSSGRPELIDTYVPDLVAGRRFAVQGAYESRDPFDYRTTARHENGSWVLDGAKRFLAGAVFADVYVLYVRDAASNDMLAFLVERTDPGVTAVSMETMGLRTMGLGQVLLHDVRLPDRRLIWQSDGLSELNTYARNRRLMSACGVVGAIEGVIESCVESLDTRRRGGRPVMSFPNVERSVGEMWAHMEAARSTILRALDGTRAADRDPYFDVLATTAKYHVSECALRIGQLVMTLQGGEGYMSASPWEGFMRDMLGLIGGQGSQELLLIQLGQRTIVDLAGRRLRQQGSERGVAALADAWWVLAAREAAGRVVGPVPPAVQGILDAAGLADQPQPAAAAELAALLDRADGLLAAVRAGAAPDELPPGPGPALDAELAESVTRGWRFVACLAAEWSGLLGHLVRPATAAEAAARAGLHINLTSALLEVLAPARIVRSIEGGRWAVDPGLERCVMGGPRTAAFRARLHRAATGAGVLGGRDVDPGRGAEIDPPGCGDDAPMLAEVLAVELLTRLEGLDERLAAPDAGIGCLAHDGARSAHALAAEVPDARVLAVGADGTGSGCTPANGTVQRRPGDVADVRASDRLALVWLPVAGLPVTSVTRAIGSAARALVPGGWIVVPSPVAPRRALGAAVAHAEASLSGRTPIGDGVVEELLRDYGFGHIRVVWEDVGAGLRMIAARRP